MLPPGNYKFSFHFQRVNTSVYIENISLSLLFLYIVVYPVYKSMGLDGTSVKEYLTCNGGDQVLKISVGFVIHLLVQKR